MRVLFAGTPEFAEAALRAIVAAGHQIVLVLTRADQPAGRGQQIQFSPVKRAAIEHSIALLQPKSLRDPALVQVLADQKADVMVVAAYGRILPPEVLRLPRLGCINIHASLLPRWRGAAPIQRAIEAGDEFTGVTIMQMDEGLDTGDMLLIETLTIAQTDNAASIHDRLMAIGATRVVSALAGLEAGKLIATPQPDAGITYARKIEKSEAGINWALPARQIHDKIRAFDPFPGCVTKRLARSTDASNREGSNGKPIEAVSGELLKIWRTRLPSAEVALDPVVSVVPVADRTRSTEGAQLMGRARSIEPGTLIAVNNGQVCVQCGGNSWLDVLELQKPGGKRLSSAEFLKGFPLYVGDRFF
jgi:methionyl-tRNA formyltransferase